MSEKDTSKNQTQQQPLWTVSDLLYLMKRLRKADTGCPWDLKQTWQSITASTIEEAYEVVGAIESGDKNKIREELGDLLFQVVFYSQFAEEEQVFNFNQVVDTLVNKLISRHPHVFPAGNLHAERDRHSAVNEQEVNASWEEIKKGEREQRGEQGVLADVAVSLPALARAEKLQKRASRVGLDWVNAKQVIAKLREEVDELENALNTRDTGDELLTELGDLLFTCVNFARFLKLDSEQALRVANRKFEQRVAWMEKCVQAEGKSLAECNADELDRYWEQAKDAGL